MVGYDRIGARNSRLTTRYLPGGTLIVPIFRPSFSSTLFVHPLGAGRSRINVDLRSCYLKGFLKDLVLALRLPSERNAPAHTSDFKSKSCLHFLTTATSSIAGSQT